MNLRGVFRRTNLVLGLISLMLAAWGGMHLQHLIDDGGGRHPGETVVMLVLALLAFAACRYGSRIGTNRE